MSITSNATAIVFSADSSAQKTAFIGFNSQRFTANGTFTIPTGVTAVKVTVIGGGGGAGNGFASTITFSIASGGGAGGYAVKYLTGLTPGNTIAVTVGAAGAAGVAGGTSSIASGTQAITTVTATGGGAGVGQGSQTSGQPGGSGGTASNGDINITGNAGNIEQVGYATAMANWTAQVQSGGSGPLGIGGKAVSTYASGGAATGYGAGGGAGLAYNGSTSTGGAGSTGAVIFEW